MSGSSLFYRDAAGNKQDASLHDSILAGGKDDLAVTMKFALSLGLSEDEVRALYGKPQEPRKRKANDAS
jgi:hypothetical protein